MEIAGAASLRWGMFLMTDHDGEPAVVETKGGSYPVTLWLIALIVVIYGITSAPVFLVSSPYYLELFDFSAEMVRQGQWWRLITGNLLHLNFSHLLNNAFAIYIFGHFLEPVIGSRRLFILILLSIAGTDWVSYMLDMGPSVGASGIGYGLMFAYIVLILFMQRLVNPDSFWPQFRSAVVLALVIMFWNWSERGNVNIWGHLGGGLAGVIYGLWLSRQLVRVYARMQVARGAADSAENVGDEPVG